MDERGIVEGEIKEVRPHPNFRYTYREWMERNRFISLPLHLLMKAISDNGPSAWRDLQSHAE